MSSNSKIEPLAEGGSLATSRSSTGGLKTRFIVNDLPSFTDCKFACLSLSPSIAFSPSRYLKPEHKTLASLARTCSLVAA